MTAMTHKQEQQIIETGAAWLKHQINLNKGLLDMIMGGRLTEADIPDDWEWLNKMLAWTPGKERAR